MAKRETKQSYQDTRSERSETEREFDKAGADAGNRAGAIEAGAAPLRDAVIGGYSNLDRMSTPGLLVAPEIQAREAAAAREISTGNLNNVLGSYRDFAAKPISDASQAAIGGDIGNVRNIANTAVPINEARMGGGGVYDEFAQTGGLNNAARANIRARAISPIGAYATGTQDELSRRMAVQSGYAPGFDAANRSLRRDAARGIVDASLGAELEIQDRVNAGRLAGAGGMSSTETNITQAKLADLQRKAQANGTAAQLEMQVADLTARYRLAGLDGEQASARAIADIEAENARNEMQINMFNANAQNQIGMFNAGNQMTAGQFNIGNQMATEQFNAGQQLAGIGGLSGVYETDLNRAEAERQRQLALLTGGANANLGYLGQQNQLAVQPGVGGNIINAVGSIAGAAAPWFPPRAGR